MYPLKDDIMRLMVVEYTGTWVQFRHSYVDFDLLDWYSGRLELWLSQYSAVHTRHIVQTILGTRRNGEYIWALESSTHRLDKSFRISQAALLPFILSLQNIALNGMENSCHERTTIP